MNILETPFADVQPDDGFSVVEVNLEPREISLHVVLREHGVLNYDTVLGAGVEVWKEDAPDVFAKGRQARAKLVLDAILRYFNTGGSWEELDSMLEAVHPFIPGGVTFAGWQYFDDDLDLNEGFPIDVFLDDAGEHVTMWVHGSHLETLTIDDYVRLMEGEDDSGDQEATGDGEDRPLRGDEDLLSECDPQPEDRDPGTARALPGPEA